MKMQDKTTLSLSLSRQHFHSSCPWFPGNESDAAAVTQLPSHSLFASSLSPSSCFLSNGAARVSPDERVFTSGVDYEVTDREEGKGNEW